MRILIVDDSPLVWRHLLDMLRDLSFVSLLAYARSLAEARRCLDGFTPDLLVLDISLPDGNGLDLLQSVQAAGLPTRVALFTNVPELRSISLALGADWYFDKSLDFKQLLELMNDRAYWLRAANDRRGCADVEP